MGDIKSMIEEADLLTKGLQHERDRYAMDLRLNAAVKEEVTRHLEEAIRCIRAAKAMLREEEEAQAEERKGE